MWAPPRPPPAGLQSSRAKACQARGRTEAAAEAIAAGKPVQSDEIVAKRIEGGVQKYLKEVSLFDQSFVKNDKQTVEQMLKAANTQVAAFTMYIVGEGIEKKQENFADEVMKQIEDAKKG